MSNRDNMKSQIMHRPESAAVSAVIAQRLWSVHRVLSLTAICVHRKHLESSTTMTMYLCSSEYTLCQFGQTIA